VVINTTNGPREVPRGHVVNTSRVVEEDLVYEDEPPEIIAVLGGNGWYAGVGNDAVPLVAFVALDSGRMYGVVVVGENARIDLTAGDVEKHPEFTGYTRQENVTKEDAR